MQHVFFKREGFISFLLAALLVFSFSAAFAYNSHHYTMTSKAYPEIQRNTAPFFIWPFVKYPTTQAVPPVPFLMAMPKMNNTAAITIDRILIYPNPVSNTFLYIHVPESYRGDRVFFSMGGFFIPQILNVGTNTVNVKSFPDGKYRILIATSTRGIIFEYYIVVV